MRFLAYGGRQHRVSSLMTPSLKMLKAEGAKWLRPFWLVGHGRRLDATAGNSQVCARMTLPRWC